MTEILMQDQGIPHVILPTSHYHIFRIQGEINSSQDYNDLLETLDTSSENDTIHLKINCFGGSLHVMKEVISSMNQTQAHLIGEITGVCMSAATVLLLGCDEFRVNEGIEWMSHTATYGDYGKEHNVYESVEFERKIVHKLVRDTYKGFHTDEEIEEILRGSDKYLTFEEVKERLEKLVVLRKEAEEQAQEDAITQAEKDMFGEPLPREAFENVDKETLIKVLRGELTEEEEAELFGKYMDSELLQTSLSETNEVSPQSGCEVMEQNSTPVKDAVEEQTMGEVTTDHVGIGAVYTTSFSFDDIWYALYTDGRIYFADHEPLGEEFTLCSQEDNLEFLLVVARALDIKYQYNIGAKKLYIKITDYLKVVEENNATS